MILEVRHKTSYAYGRPVSVSHHLLHLEPRATLRQRCLRSSLEVRPTPALRLPDSDYFGNRITFLTIEEPHDDLMILAVSRVEVQPAAPPPAEATPAWEEVAAQLAAVSAPATVEATEFALPTAATPWLPALEAYARTSFTAGRPVLEAALDLTKRIHVDFTYDAAATETHTGIAEAFELRRGVCQDFAHIEIACLRSLGLAARYVSGYLVTRPPEGRERLTGVDASHAWVSLWIGAAGWVDLDPTNDMIPSEQHVTLAQGRDYGDVAPVCGVMFGGGRHRVGVAVDVLPLG